MGTSGWQYEDWRGCFYPTELPTRGWLAHYAGRFATVEVNSSFYRLPSPETVARWARTVPDGFVFAFKASRYLTHVRRLRDCAEPLARMWAALRSAGPKLGPVLFQLPPDLPADAELLRSFVRLLPAGLRAAFEFRHPSWSAPEVAAALGSAGAALVHADRPGVRSTIIPNLGGWSYVRFHQGRPTGPGYPPQTLRAYADRIAALADGELFAYFNNDTGGAATRDATALIRLLEERGVAISGAP